MSVLASMPTICAYNVSFCVSYDLVVATDDKKIAECCRGFGADVIMTSESCRNGNSFTANFMS